LNEAVNQGVLVRGAAGPEFGSVTTDIDRELRLPPAGTSIPTHPPIKSPGVRESSEASMDLAQLQDFVEEGAPTLTKLLAGATPEFCVKIKLKGKTPLDLSKANDLLKKVNPDWQF